MNGWQKKKIKMTTPYSIVDGLKMDAMLRSTLFNTYWVPDRWIRSPPNWMKHCDLMIYERYLKKNTRNWLAVRWLLSPTFSLLAAVTCLISGRPLSRAYLSLETSPSFLCILSSMWEGWIGRHGGWLESIKFLRNNKRLVCDI